MILWDNILAFPPQNFNRNYRRQGHIAWYKEKRFAGCTPELFRRPGSILVGSVPHPKQSVWTFLLLITPLPPPTGCVQPSLQCTLWVSNLLQCSLDVDALSPGHGWVGKTVPSIASTGDVDPLPPQVLKCLSHHPDPVVR